MDFEIIYYDSKKKGFYKHINNISGEEPMIEKIGSFKNLVDVTKGNFKNVRFNDFKFKGIDATKYNLSKAVVPAATLKRFGLYNDSFFKKLSKSLETGHYTNPSDNGSSTVEYEIITPEEAREMRCDSTEERIFYISDIHLDEKIKARFPQDVTKNEIVAFLDDIIIALYNDYEKYPGGGKILFGGDISHSFTIVKMFFERFITIFRYV